MLQFFLSAGSFIGRLVAVARCQGDCKDYDQTKNSSHGASGYQHTNLSRNLRISIRPIQWIVDLAETLEAFDINAKFRRHNDVGYYRCCRGQSHEFQT